jgi:polyhydroxyalkanoate synthase subunit PhaC
LSISRHSSLPSETTTGAVTTSEESHAPESPFQVIDRSVHVAMSLVTAGLAPAALTQAFFDWYVHLAVSPGKRLELAWRALDGAVDTYAYGLRSAFGLPGDPYARALPHDERFRAPSWQSFPFNVYAHGFLSIERWWGAATASLRGVSQRHDEKANFTARQILDTVAPSNFILTNPQVLERTRAEGGANLLRGFTDWISDRASLRIGAPPRGLETFKVGPPSRSTFPRPRAKLPEAFHARGRYP